MKSLGLIYSSAIPPVLVKTNGVNVPFSTSRTRLLYCLFFSFSCSWNICFGDSDRYESAFGWHADCCLSQNPRALLLSLLLLLLFYYYYYYYYYVNNMFIYKVLIRIVKSL